MSGAEPVYQFSPSLYPIGKLVFHLHGEHGVEVWSDNRRRWVPVKGNAPPDTEKRWVSRTACGLITYWQNGKRDAEPATRTRRDHAEALGPLCKKCERKAQP